MLPTAQLNLLPLAQLILLKQTVDAASEQWEREQTERKKGTEKTTAVFADNTYTRRVYDKASTEDIGLLRSRIENTGTSDQITHSYLYDDLLRLERYSCDGANYTGFAHRYEYELRSLLTSITRAPLTTHHSQLSTQIVHDLDGYGQLLEERIYTGTGTVDSFAPDALHSHIRQSWDALGRRHRYGLGGDVASLGSIAPRFDYTFYASGRIATIAPGAFSDPWEVQYDYEDNRLLSERRFRVDGSYNARRTQTLNRRLDNTTPYRDARGRLLRKVQTANGTPLLNETLAWSDDSKLGAYTLARGAGTGTAWDDFTDSRSHTYDPDNRRLETESFLPEPTGSTRTFNYDFDSDDLGVRVKAALDNPATDAWEVNDPATTGLDAFKRVVDETARTGKRNFTVSGSSTGPGTFELFLGEGASPSTFEFLQSIDPDVDYGDGTWSIPLSLEAGQYTLEARGTHLHPDSNHQATDSSTFTVAAPDPADIATTYDAHGRVETRSWASGDIVQTFSWDAKGNLLEVEQVDKGTAETVGSYVWTAQYDGLGRRIQTEYAPAGASAIAIAQNRIKTWFDPQVEFMVAAVEHHGKREWLVHGPDLDTGYGSFQGLGGLEAVVDEGSGKTTPVFDTVHGHVVATIDLGDIANAADDEVIFKQQQFGGYGPLPGTQQKPLEVTESLTESLGWQTRRVDPTSFFVMGARHYDPLSGRFLSADPLGHSATPDLYSYAGGDPINFVDPTGRQSMFGIPFVIIDPLQASKNTKEFTDSAVLEPATAVKDFVADDGPGVFNAGGGFLLAGDVTVTRDMDGKTDVKYGLGPGAGWKASYTPTVQDLPSADGTLQTEMDISFGAGPFSGGGNLTFTGDTDGYFGYDASVSGSAKLGFLQGNAKAGFVAADLYSAESAYIDPYANANNGVATGGGLGAFALVRINWFSNDNNSDSESENFPTGIKVMPIGVNTPK